MNIENKVIVITGGARGIGLAVAKKFLKEKPKIIILVDIKFNGKILQFKSKETYQLYDRLPFQIETRIKPQISGIFTY